MKPQQEFSTSSVSFPGKTVVKRSAFWQKLGSPGWSSENIDVPLFISLSHFPSPFPDYLVPWLWVDDNAICLTMMGKGIWGRGESFWGMKCSNIRPWWWLTVNEYTKNYWGTHSKWENCMMWVIFQQSCFKKEFHSIMNLGSLNSFASLAFQLKRELS